MHPKWQDRPATAWASKGEDIYAKLQQGVLMIDYPLSILGSVPVDADGQVSTVIGAWY